MPPVNPDEDPVILALERDEAYATVNHHSEMREQAERNEKYQILCQRLLRPKAHAFVSIERLIAGYRLGSTGTVEQLISDIERHIRIANDELRKLTESDSELSRIMNSIELRTDHCSPIGLCHG